MLLKAGARNAHSCQKTIGSAISSAAQRLTRIEVENGSIGLNVTGFVSIVGQRPVQPVEDVAVEDVRDDERGDDRDQADEDARPELAQVLDERGLLAVAKAPREEPHGPT